MLKKLNVLVGLYVDDLLIIGPHEQVKNELDKIRSRFELRVVESVKEFVGCEIMVKDNVIVLHQRKNIMKHLHDFEPELKNLKWKGCPLGSMVKLNRTDLENTTILNT